MKTCILICSFVFICSCNNTGTESAATSTSDSSISVQKGSMKVQIDTSISINNTCSYDSLVLASFKQGDDGDFNCAAISVIKCAIATFNADRVFKEMSHNSSGYVAILRNGDTVTLSNDEKRLADNKCGFSPVAADSQIINLAKLMYAIMAKNGTKLASKDSKNFSKDYSQMVKILHGETGGRNAIVLPQLLGLSFESIGWRDRLIANAFIFENGYHAVFGECGNFDNYGTPTRLTFINFRTHYGKNLFKDFSRSLYVLKDFQTLERAD